MWRGLAEVPQAMGVDTESLVDVEGGDAGEPYALDEGAGESVGASLENSLLSAVKNKGGKSPAKAAKEDKSLVENDEDFNPFEALRSPEPSDELDELDPSKQDDDEQESDEDEELEGGDKAKKKPDAEVDEKFDVMSEIEELGLGGLKDKYDSPKKLFRGLVDAARLVGQRNEQAAAYERLRNDPQSQIELRDQLLKLHPVQAAAAQDVTAATDKKPVEPASPKGMPAAPIFDPAWLQWFTDGKLRADVPAETATAIHKYAVDHKNYEERSRIQPTVQEIVQSLLDEKLKPFLDKQDKSEEQRKKEREQEQASADHWNRLTTAVNKYDEALTARDAEGKKIFHPDGRPVLSAGGEVFKRKIHEAIELSKTLRSHSGLDLQDPDGLARWAYEATLEHFKQSPPATSAKNGNKDKRLNRTAGGDTRGGKQKEDLLEGVGAGSGDDLFRALARAVGKSRGG